MTGKYKSLLETYAILLHSFSILKKVIFICHVVSSQKIDYFHLLSRQASKRIVQF